MKKIMCLIICCLICCSTISPTVFAAEAEIQNSDEVYMTDFDNLGELFSELENEKFDELPDSEKQILLNISIEDVLNTEEDSSGSQEAQLSLLDEIQPYAVLPPIIALYNVKPSSASTGRMTAVSQIRASSVCPTLSMVGLIYDPSGKVIDRDISVGSNTKYEIITMTESGLSSGKKYKAYTQFHAVFPSGYNPSMATDTKSSSVTIK